MKITVKDNELILTEVFNGVGIQTDDGLFGIAQRDGGIEVMLDGKQVYPPDNASIVEIYCEDEGEKWLAGAEYDNLVIMPVWGDSRNEAVAVALEKLAEFIRLHIK